MYERSQLCVKVESRSTSRSIWTLYILPLFYLRDQSLLALTCVAKNASVEINFNTVNEISKVRTRELCLCLAPFVFLGSVVSTSLIYVTRECNRILFRGWASVNRIKKIRLVVEERWTWRPRSRYLQLQLQFLSFFSRTFVNTANFARKEILKLTESLTRWESCDIYQYCNSYHKFSRRIRRRRRRLVWTAEILLWKKKTIHVVLISFAVVFGLLVFDICL